ncbi:MAG TPA: serine hydrolase domain-containing protein [Verrucomicrobiae bacterium]|jgi:CubicO group peptidase (beta-lactamase class C family)|nr:serine hydrolase domain-containing protein [Verrucomicrobiae bacterium]
MNLFRNAALLALSTASFAAAASFAQQDAGELERNVDKIFAAFDKPGSPGCALGVVRNGEFVYKKGYGEGSLELSVPLTPESVFYMGSVSKQFTAASVVLAAEQGYLSLDDDVRKYVPELPSYGKTITLREMLHHTSGFRDILGLLLLAGRNFEDIHLTPELLDLLSRQKALNYMPGDEYLYSNTNFFLMSVIIHRATGKTLTQFADENIFKPLGMAHTRFYEDHSVVVPGRIPAYEPRPDGGFRIDWSTNFDKVGDGGLMSSVDDLLFWDRNFYDNKLGKGTLLKEMQTQGVLNNGKKIEYALGLLISSYRGLPIVEHGGALFGYRTELLRFPQQKFSVITLCNLGTSNPGQLSYQVADLYLAGQLSPESPASAAASVDPQPFAGWYRNLESHSVLEITASKDGIGAFGTLFKPRDATHFVATPGPEMIFDRQPNSGMRLTLNFKDSAPQTFERYEPLQANAENFGQYEGEYTSAELQATYRFAVKGGKLTLATNWREPAVLEATILDEFQGPFGTAIVFRRDAAGHITGCDLFAGRVRNIAFTKAAAKTAQ